MKIPRTALSIFRKESSFLIASHIDPDGDAIGSCLALALALRADGRQTHVYNRDQVPSYYRFLPGQEMVVNSLDALPTENPVLVLLDCNSPQRSATSRIPFGTSVVIDHHETESDFGTVRWIEPDAAATGMMVYHLIRRLGLKITPAIATNLYAAIAVDTGTFRYSNTTAEVLRAGASLVDAGADPYVVAESLYETWSPGRFRLLILALETLEISGGVAIIHITQEMFTVTGTSSEDTENFSNMPRMIGPVRVSAMLRQVGSDEWKVSLRSKGSVNVARIAEQFGGGGHQNAAGFRIKADLAAARHTIREAAERL